jgi:hypothetical protein
VASAFVSYAREDQEFVLALIERLQQHDLQVRYDQVALRIGDSLIRAISREITDGDFLIAVVSPDSLNSEWCQTELALAKSQGIAARRVKVLPVRFRGAQMPPMLEDTFWGDADRDDLGTLASRLAAAMQAHLEGRGSDAAREADEAPILKGGPAHGEIPGDLGVAQIDEVAQWVWGVFNAWAAVWDSGANISGLKDPQRRLRWALDALPERVRIALPVVERVASADWDELFAGTELDDAERDIREELRSVRTQVAQGLPVTRRWTIAEDLGRVSAGRRDAISHLWEISRGDESGSIQVFISGTAMAANNETLPHEVAQAKDTNGRSVVATLLAMDDPPGQVSVTTAGISLTLP